MKPIYRCRNKGCPAHGKDELIPNIIQIRLRRDHQVLCTRCGYAMRFVRNSGGR